MDFKGYTDKAITRYSLAGLNALGRELNISSAAISQMNTGKTLPSEETMLKLAELAGMPKEEALIDLNLWRSKNNPELQSVWIRLGKMIKIVPIICALGVSTADFYNTHHTTGNDFQCILCIQIKILSIFKSLFLLKKKYTATNLIFN